VKGWTQQTVRREVLMVSDGIDRLRGETPAASRLGPSFGPVYHSMPHQCGRHFGERNQPAVQRHCSLLILRRWGWLRRWCNEVWA